MDYKTQYLWKGGRNSLMELTLRQEQGLKIAVQRYLDGEKCTVISGYALFDKVFLDYKLD